jgi:uncharacterized protein YbaR (Trm112 family)
MTKGRYSREIQIANAQKIAAQKISKALVPSNVAKRQEEQATFREFSATELFCPKCRQAQPVREKLLLILASGEIKELVCRVCGTSVGRKS